MKKLLLLTTLIFSIKVSSQTDSTRLQHRHELGADITGLLSQFLNLTSSTSLRPMPTYIIGYRFYFQNASIRAGIGGSYSKNPVTNYRVNDEPRVFYNAQTSYSFRIGFEFVKELSKRWQTFYGIDFRPAIYSIDYQAQFSNGGYIVGNKENATTYGFAPLLGFRYHLNSRVSLITEASFVYFIQNSNTQKTYLSQELSQFPFKENDKVIQSTTTGASFSQPLFLTLAVRL